MPLSEETTRACVQLLKQAFTVPELQYLCRIRQTFIISFPDKDKDEWFIMQHLSVGMNIRNLFRRAGYTEEALHINNWDDYYMRILNITLDEVIKEYNFK